MREAGAGQIGAREIAGVAHSAACLYRVNSLGVLFVRLANAAERCVSAFNDQHLVNTAWAFATASHSNAQFFSALGRAVERHVGKFKPQGLANTVWAFATAA